MPSGLSVSLTGMSQLAARLNRFSANLPDAVGRELYRDLVGVMFESQKIVPYDEGDLHDSGETDRPQISGGTISVSLHYGGGSVDYALIQHENLDYQHPRGGQAKFLESVLNQWTAHGPQEVVARALRGVR